MLGQNRYISDFVHLRVESDPLFFGSAMPFAQSGRGCLITPTPTISLPARMVASAIACGSFSAAARVSTARPLRHFQTCGNLFSRPLVATLHGKFLVLHRPLSAGTVQERGSLGCPVTRVRESQSLFVPCFGPIRHAPTSGFHLAASPGDNSIVERPFRRKPIVNRFRIGAILLLDADAAGQAADIGVENPRILIYLAE